MKSKTILGADGATKMRQITVGIHGKGGEAGITHKKGTDGALQGKRWNCSKNLVRPEPEYHIISDREYFKKEPKAIKGYYVDKNSVSMGVHSPEYYGYGYLRYTLVKITDRGG